MKKYFILFFGLLMCVSVVRAQDVTVTGIITSSEDQLSLPGVSILIKGTTRGTISDIDGKYSIDGVKPIDVLVFKYVGFETLEITVGTQRTISLVMAPDAQELEGVVVTALGIKREKREIGYTMESFTGAEIERSNAPNVINALSGRSAGVNVTNSNGLEGGTTRITIRGNNNITSDNQPLIVVDGIPLANDPGMTNIGRGQDWGSAINNINQQDIEDMSILKGPTASALYGSKGANGVILITTKRGSKQKGIGVNYNFSHKIITPYRYREVQDVYGGGGPLSLSEPTFMEDSTGTYIYPSATHTNNGPFGMSTSELFGYYGTAVSWGPKMEGQMVRWWDGEMRPWSPQPDNLKLFFGNGNTISHNLSFSGGGEMGTIRVSLTRTDHDPIIQNSNFDQTTVNLGSNINISSKVKADLAISYIDYHRLNSPVIGESGNAVSKGSLYSWPRSWKGLELEHHTLPDGSRNEWDGNYPFEYISPYLGWNQLNNNTVFNRNKLIGAISLIYEVTPWLNILGRVGLDYTLNQFETQNKPSDILGLLNGYYSNELGRDVVRNNEILITAHKENIFNSKISAKLSVGGTQWQRSKYGIKGHTGKWVNPWVYAFNNYDGPIYDPSLDYQQITPGSIPIDTMPLASSQLPGEYRWEKNIHSVYAFLNLSYENYLFLEATGRNDWSSSLPIDDNSYFYPSVSLSFIPTEAFNFNFGPVNFWKIRGAIAGTATDTDPYQLDFVYSTGSFGNSQTAFLPGTIPPIALQPQFANSYEGGTTVGLFNNRINIDFTYYYIKSHNQILSSPIPYSSGSNRILINNGVLENKGYEIIFNGVIINNRNLIFETGLNFSRNRNFVVSLGEGAEILEIADIWGLNGPAMAVREGEEYGTIVGYDYVYHDNGQPILNDEGTHYLITENRVPIGNASPDFMGGWTTRISYKGFTLRTLVDTKWGGDIYCGSYVIGLQTGQSPETLIEREGGGLPYTDPDGNVSNIGVILPGVYADGTPNDKVVHYYFKYLPNAGGWGKFISTPGIVENTWVKMREISLSYQLPSKILGKTKFFQNLTLSIVGRDLFYIYTTLPDKINPEGLNGSGNAQGLEWAAYPGVRSISFGINASF